MFRYLDFATPLEEFHEHLALLKCAAYWFLGDCCEFFAKGDALLESRQIVQSILLRLQKAAVLGDWEVRREAIRSLGKIALVSEDPVRICVYEMLQNLQKAVSGEDAEVYNDLVEPILDVLDDVYEAIENEEDPAPILESEAALFHQNVIH